VAEAQQLKLRPRSSRDLRPGGIRRGISLCARAAARASQMPEHSMRSLIAVAAIAVATLVVSHASAQTCLRPKWTECISFPNGGRHTGISPYRVAVQLEVPAGAEICVSNEWEVEADTYAQFSRNGAPWPNRDWEVDVDTFCFYKN
jgi:hypothetical protein